MGEKEVEAGFACGTRCGWVVMGVLNDVELWVVWVGGVGFWCEWAASLWMD